MWQPDCLACHVPLKPKLNARRCGRMLGPHPHLWKMLWSPRGHANCSPDEGLVRSSVAPNDIMIALIVAVWVPSPNDLTSLISPRIKRHNNWIGGLRRADPLHTSAHSYPLKHTSCAIRYDTLCPFFIFFMDGDVSQLRISRAFSVSSWINGSAWDGQFSRTVGMMKTTTTKHVAIWWRVTRVTRQAGSGCKDISTRLAWYSNFTSVFLWIPWS